MTIRFPIYFGHAVYIEDTNARIDIVCMYRCPHTLCVFLYSVMASTSVSVLRPLISLSLFVTSLRVETMIATYFLSS